jgi:hypothetical protein
MARSSRVCHRARRAAASAVVRKDSVRSALKLICGNKYSCLVMRDAAKYDKLLLLRLLRDQLAILGKVPHYAPITGGSDAKKRRAA